MSTEKTREDFEEWVLGKWPETDLHIFNDGEYCGFTLQHCWKAWQASRAAVVVALPDGGTSEEYAYGTPVVARGVALYAIQAAGLKVKP